jgi:hypothetical protein
MGKDRAKDAIGPAARTQNRARCNERSPSGLTCELERHNGDCYAVDRNTNEHVCWRAGERHERRRTRWQEA